MGWDPTPKKQHHWQKPKKCQVSQLPFVPELSTTVKVSFLGSNFEERLLQVSSALFHFFQMAALWWALGAHRPCPTP